ncbi:hypothetical protein ACE1OC_43120 (plasmid) [Streptomyces sp. DSM 116496]|uniref:hypothetical protein n=1 Tax=Streptomyces stoeckheimensis TaxID=3344656 RepID=UPI0038B32075
MGKTKRTLAIGAALIALTAGCDSAKSPDGNSAPSGERNIPLTELSSISVDSDPLGDLKERPKILSEVQYGDVRLIAYATSDSCGIVTTPKNDPQHSDIHLVSKWPAPGQGAAPYPAGPYNSASGNGSGKAWASLLCSKDAMVIEYTLDSASSSPGEIRGEATATPVPNNQAASRIIIGDPATRLQIQHQADKSGTNTPSTGPR